MAHNAVRVLRALQLRKAVLLEGSPGVGKTSLVGAIARASGARPSKGILMVGGCRLTAFWGAVFHRPCMGFCHPGWWLLRAQG